MAWLALLGWLAAGAVAAAADEDGARAEALLRETEASPKGAVAKELIVRSRAALERAARLRAAGDETHARLADRAARTWAEAARDVARAAAVEDSAATARRAASDAGTIADRERALLEEAIAQSGRLRAQIEALEREGKEQPARTSTAASAPTTKPAKGRAPAGGKGPSTADGGAR
jgi:hypothetical protein